VTHLLEALGSISFGAPLSYPDLYAVPQSLQSNSRHALRIR